MLNINRYLPWIGFTVIAGTVVIGAGMGTFLTPLIVLCLAGVLIMLLPHSRSLLMGTLILLASEVTLPFLSENMSFYMVAGALMWASVSLQAVLSRGRPLTADEKKICFWVVGFIVVLVMTASLRGSGFRFLNSEKWGGRPYLLLLFAAITLLFSMRVSLTATQCRRTVMGYCLAGLIPSFAAIAMHYGGVDFFAKFVGQGEDAAKMVYGLAGTGDPMFRLQVANVGATYMFLMMWMVVYSKNFTSHVTMAMCGLAGLLLTGISGHRISLLYGVVLSVAFCLLNVRVPLRKRIINWYSASFMVVIVSLILLAPHLPYTYQRSLSWLPYVDLASHSQADADVTAAWRIEVWKRALDHASQYLVLGKGFAFSREEMLSYVQWTMNDYNFVLTSHNYHNGLIHILIDLGLPGLLFAIGFVGVVLKQHYVLLKHPWIHPFLGHLHRVMLAGFVAQIVVYVAVGGGATTFVRLFFWTIMLEQLRKADLCIAPEAKVAS